MKDENNEKLLCILAQILWNTRLYDPVQDKIWEIIVKPRCRRATIVSNYKKPLGELVVSLEQEGRFKKYIPTMKKYL